MSWNAKFQRIAQVLKSNGADGELVIGFREIAPEDLDISEPVFIEFDGLPVPFFFESFTRRGQNKVLARLTGIRTFEDAEELAGKSLYIDPDRHGIEFDEDIADILPGWKLEDADGANYGVVNQFLDFNGNSCLEVTKADGSSTLIPFHDDLILDIDEQNRIIKLHIPSGL